MRAMQEFLGIKDEMTMKATTGLGGGIGLVPKEFGGPCGLVSAGAMVIGMVFGRDNFSDMDSIMKTYGVSAKWMKRFQEKWGDVKCWNIVGVDFTNATEVEEYMGHNPKFEFCAELTGAAARLLAEIIDEEKCA
ncbi:MAG: C-GCAxxG-C-C family protein [Methermicoccaceae archaeon]